MSDYIKQLEVTNSLLEDKLEKVTKEFFEFRKKLYLTNAGTSTLIEASIASNVEAVKFHLENGLDIHKNDDFALRWVSEHGHLELVKLLLANGADIHARDDYALCWASEGGHKEVVKCLVENGANIHTNHDCALFLASQKGHKEVVDYLKSQGSYL